MNKLKDRVINICSCGGSINEAGGVFDAGVDCAYCGEKPTAINIDKLLRIEKALGLVLPMAKGYAHKHNVGANWDYCQIAAAALDSNGGEEDGE